MWGTEENAILGGGAAQLALLGEHAPDTCGSRGRRTPAAREDAGHNGEMREGGCRAYPPGTHARKEE
jgi:hypothetical protein